MSREITTLLFSLHSRILVPVFFFFFFFFFFRWQTFLCAEEDTGQRADTFQSIPCSSQESPGKALLGHRLAQRTESSYSW